MLPGGDDWTVKRPDGVLELDLRVTLETDDGALIHMTFEGIRDDGAPGAPYFRTLPRFETAEPKYSFLNRLLAVGKGEIRADGPVHVIEEIPLDQPDGASSGSRFWGKRMRTFRLNRTGFEEATPFRSQ